MEFDLNFRRTFDKPLIGSHVKQKFDVILTDMTYQQKIVRVRQVVYTIDQRKQNARKEFYLNFAKRQKLV